MWAARYPFYYVDPLLIRGLWLHGPKDSPVILQLVWLTFKSTRDDRISNRRTLTFSSNADEFNINHFSVPTPHVVL